MAYLETLEITTVDKDIEQLFKERLAHLRFLYGPLDAYAPKEYYINLTRNPLTCPN